MSWSGAYLGDALRHVSQLTFRAEDRQSPGRANFFIVVPQVVLAPLMEHVFSDKSKYAEKQSHSLKLTAALLAQRVGKMHAIHRRKNGGNRSSISLSPLSEYSHWNPV